MCESYKEKINLKKFKRKKRFCKETVFDVKPKREVKGWAGRQVWGRGSIPRRGRSMSTGLEGEMKHRRHPEQFKLNKKYKIRLKDSLGKYG